MSNRIFRVLAATFTIVGAHPVAANCFDQSRSLLEMLSQQRYIDAAIDFDAATKKRLPPSKLQQVWEELQMQVGSYRKAGTPQNGVARASLSRRVLTPLFFEKTEMTAEVTCDGEHITALLFLPSISEGVR